jgi:predicted PurR-regulated permease PerM
VTETGELLLGVIAVAVAVMALVQVGAVVAGLRAVRRVEQLATQIETGLKPVLANLTSVSAEAAKAASAAAGQVERIDRIFTDLSSRIDQTVGSAQRIVSGPAREGMAIVAGVRAAVSALQGMREATRRRSATRASSFEEEEESLFIG